MKTLLAIKYCTYMYMYCILLCSDWSLHLIHLQMHQYLNTRPLYDGGLLSV